MNFRLALLLALTVVLSQCTKPSVPATKTEQASPNSPASSKAPPDVTNAADGELQHYVGKIVTMRGKFAMRGVVAPFIQIGSQSIYLKPKESYSWGKEYERMEDREVRVTGTLGFEHFQPSPGQHPPDYFYFQAETARIELIK